MNGPFLNITPWNKLWIANLKVIKTNFVVAYFRLWVSKEAENSNKFLLQYKHSEIYTHLRKKNAKFQIFDTHRRQHKERCPL